MRWSILILFFVTITFAQDDFEHIPADDLPTHGIPIDDKATRYTTPTIRVYEDKMPRFDDDLDFVRIEVAIERQLARWRQYPPSGTIRYGTKTYPLSRVRKTLEVFLQLSQETRECVENQLNDRAICYDELNAQIKSRFNVYRPKLTSSDPRHGEDKDTFFTAYYSPTLVGSKVRTPEFRHGIYTKPRSERLRKSTRNQIIFEDRLEGRGLAEFYVKDLFELYLLHVQGGGRVVVEENGKMESYYILFDGTNSQPFRFISKYMQQQGYIDDLTIESQREFLLARPEKEEEIYNYCPSFIYYKQSDRPPVGSSGVSVTPGRSIATDYRIYKFKGALAFVEAQRPTEESVENGGDLDWKEFSRFVLDQDTGGAIRGKARIDFYHGEDKYAEAAAFHTEATGRMFYLILK